MEWIDLAWNSDKWRAVVNTTMYSAISVNAGHFFFEIATELSDCQEEMFFRGAS